VILKNNLQICQASLEDIPFLIPLLQQLFCIETDFTFNAKKHTQGLEQLIQNNSSYVFIGKFENEIIAMMTLQTLISSVIGTKSALIEDFIVHEEYHHLGVGTQLFNHVKQFALTQNFKRLQLVCDENNGKAKAFYGKKLFKESNLKAWYCSLE
jgi:GNAT superfamily N-acetyltransferase